MGEPSSLTTSGMTLMKMRPDAVGFTRESSMTMSSASSALSSSRAAPPSARSVEWDTRRTKTDCAASLGTFAARSSPM